jgi:thiamine pyrophosphate-dependent acetolactate synthase large subunit-like protein
MTIPVFELLAEDVRALDVDVAFGLMSDDTATFINALGPAGIRFIACRHENMAVAMAEGYAAATGRLGVAVIGRGPASANTINAATQANRTGSRMLIIYGDEARTALANAPGPDIKAFDQIAVLSASGLRTFKPFNHASLRGTLQAAADAANQGQAAALLIPKDILEEKVERPEPFAYQPAPRIFIPTQRGAPGVEVAADLLKRSRKPIIIAGWGAVQSGARDAIERLGERIGAGYLTTLRASGFFDGNPRALGLIGSFSHQVGRRFLDEADCIIAFGASLNIFSTSAGDSLPPGVPIIHVDRDRAQIGRHCYADVAVVGDAGEAAREIAARIEGSAYNDDWARAVLDALNGFDPDQDYQEASTQRTVDPRSAAVALAKVLPAERNVVLDVGNMFQVAPFLGVRDPRRLKYTSEFGSIGLAFGTALGFCAAAPDRATVLFTGDGSLLMTLGELSTCVSEELPLIIVVMNDACLSAERHYLDLREMPVDKTMLPMIDFAEVAACFGFQSATVTSIDQIEALAPMLQDRSSPILIDVKINPAVAAGFLAEFVLKK